MEDNLGQYQRMPIQLYLIFSVVHF